MVRKHRKRVGIDDSRKVFHSFRHGLATRLKEAKVEDSVSADILGHVLPGQTRSRYMDAASVELLREALERVRFNIDVK